MSNRSDLRLFKTFELTAFALADGREVTQFNDFLVVWVEYDPGTVGPGELARVYYFDEAAGAWQALDGWDGRPGRARGETTHFTAFGGATETFETPSGAAATGPRLFADPMTDADRVEWTLRSGAATGPLVTTIAPPAGTWSNSAGVINLDGSVTQGTLTLNNSDNYWQNILIQFPVKFDQNNDNFGGVVFGWKSATDYWIVVKDPNPGAGSRRLSIARCTSTPCASPHTTFYQTATGSYSATDWVWFEILLTPNATTSTSTDVVITLRNDLCGSNAYPCGPNASQQVMTVTTPLTQAIYSGGQVGFVAIGESFDVARPIVRGILPTGWSTCMNNMYTSTTCTGAPGVVWDGIVTGTTGSTKTLQVFTNKSGDAGYAYESQSPLAAGSYGLRALIKPNLTGSAVAHAVLWDVVSGTAIAETGPDLGTTAAHECFATTPAGWYDCQVSFTLASSRNVELRLQVSGAGTGTANFDSVSVSTISAGPTLWTVGGSGNNKTAYGPNDDVSAGTGGIQIRLRQDSASPLATCGTCYVRVYKTVSGVTTFVAQYLASDFNSGTGTEQTPDVGPTVSYSAVYIDASGVRSAASVSPPSAPGFIIDSTGPTITGAASPAANAAGWNNSAVTVTFTCRDNESGMPIGGCAGTSTQGTGTANAAAGTAGANVTATWTISTETPFAGVYVTGTATDVAANVATATVGPIRIDMTAPTVTFAITGTLNASGWYTTPVTVTFTCTDALSGMSSCATSGASTNVSSTTGGSATVNETASATVVGTGVDVAGNTRVTSTATLKVDYTRPVTTIGRIGNSSTAGDPAHGASFNASTIGSATYVSGTFTDATSGAGSVGIVLRRADGQYWSPGVGWVGSLVTMTTTLTSTGAGAWTWVTNQAMPSGANWTETSYTIYSVGTDAAGNAETFGTVFATFTVDSVPPTNASVVVCKTGPCGSVSDLFTNTQSVRLHLHAEDGNTVFAYALGQDTTSAANARTNATALQGAGYTTIAPATPTYDDTNVPFTLTAGEGIHYIAAEYRDTAGNWCCDAAGTQVVTSIILDTVSPTISVTSPVSSTVYGAVTVTIQVQISDATSGFNAAPTVTVQQSSSAAVNATLTGCGATTFPVPAAPPSSTGTITCSYTYLVVSGLGEGTATITAAVADRATNSASATGSFLVDTLPPTITAAGNKVSAASAAYATGTWTNTDVVVTFSCVDGGQGIASGGCVATGSGGAASASGGPGSSGQTVTATYTYTANTTALGVYATGTATDKGGNMATVTYGPILIDKTAPSVSVTSISGTAGNNGWYTSAVTVSIGCTDALSGIQTSPSGCVTTGGTTNTPGVATATATLSSSTLGTVVTATATDRAGNTATVSTAAIKIDVTKPTSTITFPAHNSSFNGSTISQLSVATGTAIDATSGIEYVTLTLQRASDGWYWHPGTGWAFGAASIGTSFTGGTVPGTRNWQTAVGAWPATADWTEDVFTLRSAAQDYAGLIEDPGAAAAANSNYITFKVDSVPPVNASVVVCKTGPCGSVSDLFTNFTTVTLHLHAEDGNEVAYYKVGEGLSAAAALTAASGTAQVTIAIPTTPYDDTNVTSAPSGVTLAAAEGVHYIAALYADLAGNWCCGTAGTMVYATITLDQTAPTVTVLSPAATDVYAAVAVPIQVLITDALSGFSAAPTVTVKQGSTTTAATLTGCSPGTFPGTAIAGPASATCTYSYTVSSTLGDGVASITATVADRATNVRSGTGSFLVDTQPPTVTAVGNKVTAIGAVYATNTWTNTDVVVTFSCVDGGQGIATAAAGGCIATGSGGSASANGGPGGSGQTVTATYTYTAETTALGVYATGTALDKSGNAATTTYGPILIDKTPPTITSYSVVPAAPNGANGWYVSDITVQITCGDALSGMATNGCVIGAGAGTSFGTTTASTTVTVDTTVASLTGTATDRAGNSASISIPPGTYKLDKTKPASAVTFPAHGASFNASNVGSLTVVSGTATDATSGVDSVAVFIQRQDTLQYWDPITAGGSWVASPVTITTMLSGPATSTVWVTNQPLPAAAAWPETQFIVWSVATDDAGNVENNVVPGVVAPGASSNKIRFEVDATAPGNASVCVYYAPTASCTGSISPTYVTSLSGVSVHLYATDANNITQYTLGVSKVDANAAATSANTVRTSGGICLATMGTGGPCAFALPATVTDVVVSKNLPALGDGVYYVAAQFRDGVNWCCAGLAPPEQNQAFATTSFTLDTQAPTFTFVSALPLMATSGTVVTIRITAYDLTSGVAAIPTVTVQQLAAPSATTATLVPGSCTPAGGPPWTNTVVTCDYTYTALSGYDGGARVTVSAADQAGHANSLTQFNAFVVDSVGPYFQSINFNLTTDSGATYTPGTWTNQDVFATYVCADLVGLKPAGTGCTASPVPSTATETISLSNKTQWKFTTSTTAAGDTIGGRAEDIAGNVTTTAVSAVRIDKVLPTSTITAPSGAAPFPGPTFPTITGTSSDALTGTTLSGIQAVQVALRKVGTSPALYWTGAMWSNAVSSAVAATTTDGWATWSVAQASLPSNANLDEGSYEICSRATDAAGNVQTASTSCSTISINQAPYVTSVEPSSGAIVPRSLSQIVIRFSEAVFDSANGALDAADYAAGAEVEVFDVTGGFLLAASTVSCDSPCRNFTITLPSTTSPLVAAHSFEIRVRGGGLGSGIVDSAGGGLALADGTPQALFTSTFRTPNPTSIPFSNDDTWLGTPATIATMTPARRDSAAASANSHFYVFGGLNASGTAVSTVQSYNPATNTWSAVTDMPVARYGHAAVAVGTAIYVIGGANASGALSSVSIFYSSASGAGSWGSGPSLPAARKYAAAAYDPGTNAIYVMGGQDSGGKQVLNVYKLSMSGGSTWQELTSDPMPATRFRTQFTLSTVNTLSGYRLIAAGGTLSATSTSADVFIPSNPAGSRWVPQAVVAGLTMPARSLHGAAVLNDYLYLIGGLNPSNATLIGSIYYLDPLVTCTTASCPMTWVAAGSLPAGEGRAAFGGQVAVLGASTSPATTGIMIAGGRTTSEATTVTVLAGQHS